MRALVILLFVLGAVAFMASCGSEVTEVAWKNSNSSQGSIQEIVWANGVATWNETVALDSTSSSKEVATTVGTVECKVDTGGGAYDVANNVYINDNLGAVSLTEGSSQVLTVKASH
jgi:hypothetical protein